MTALRPAIRPRDEVIDQAIALHRAWRDAPHDAAREAAFRSWIAADLEHAVAADLVAATWAKTAKLGARPAAAAWRREAMAPPQAYRRPLRALAASVVLAALVGAGVAFLEGKRATASYATARGERLDVALGDGSTLHLNGDSRIDVAFGWFGRRLELRQGEAEFQVAKDRLRPFTVHAGRLSVRAVGTDFTVRRQAETIAVVLVEGIVAVQPETANFTPVTLQPGSKAVLAADAVRPMVHRIDPAVELAWRDGQIMLKRTPLAEALQEFARYTGNEVLLQSPEIGRLQVSGTFRTTDLQPFLDVIARVHTLQWKRVGDRTYRLERR